MEHEIPLLSEEMKACHYDTRSSNRIQTQEFSESSLIDPKRSLNPQDSRSYLPQKPQALEK